MCRFKDGRRILINIMCFSTLLFSLFLFSKKYNLIISQEKWQNDDVEPVFSNLEFVFVNNISILSIFNIGVVGICL